MNIREPYNGIHREFSWERKMCRNLFAFALEKNMRTEALSKRMTAVNRATHLVSPRSAA